MKFTDAERLRKLCSDVALSRSEHSDVAWDYGDASDEELEAWNCYIRCDEAFKNFLFSLVTDWDGIKD